MLRAEPVACPGRCPAANDKAQMNIARRLVPLQEHACPLCGQPNDCAAAKTGSLEEPCWCRTVQFSPAVLARVPVSQVRKACICRACAERPEA